MIAHVVIGSRPTPLAGRLVFPFSSLVIGDNEFGVDVAAPFSFSRASDAGAIRGTKTGTVAGTKVRVGTYGYLLEAAATNLVPVNGLGSWGAANITVGNPVITTGTADPNGGTSAISVAFPAVGAAQASFIYWNRTAASTRYTASVWARVASGTGTTYLMVTPGGSTYFRTTLTLTTTWQRFHLTATALNPYFQIGVDRRDSGQANQPATTVELWGGEIVNQNFYSSWDPGDADLSTRAVDILGVNHAAHLRYSEVSGSMTFRAAWPTSENQGTNSNLHTLYSATDASALGCDVVWNSNLTTKKFFARAAGGIAWSLAQSFAADTDHTVSWRFTVGGKIYIAVDAEAEVEGTTVPTTFVPGIVSYLGYEPTDPISSLSGQLIDVSISHSGTLRTIVACEGDSLTAIPGFGGVTSWPARMTLPALGTYTDTAVSATTTVEMLTRWTATLKSRAYTHFAGLMGVNDVRLDVPIATTQANLTQMWSEAAARGMKVIAMTTTPFHGDTYGYWTAGRQATQDTLNAWIRSEATANGYTLVDTWALLEDPANPDYLLPAYANADGIHLSQAGEDVVAAAVQAAL